MFFDRYSALCKEKGKSPTGVAIELNVSRATVNYWKNGNVPKQEILIKIADYFNVSVDYLLGNKEKGYTVTPSDDEVLRFALWGGDSDIIDEEMLEDVKDFAKLLAEKKKRKMVQNNE